MLDGQFDFPLRAQMVNTLLMRGAALTDLDGFLSMNDDFYGSGIMSTMPVRRGIPAASSTGARARRTLCGFLRGRCAAAHRAGS